jgi:hypothetical protein
MDKQACRLCRKSGELQRSHILPDALFRRIKRENSGKLVRFDDSKNSFVDHSIESWWQYLLCSSCESIIAGYEKYGLETLRRATSAPLGYGAGRGVTLKGTDYATLKLFGTSLLWRAAVSDLDVFAKVILPAPLLEAARNSLLSGQPLSAFKLGCKIVRLFDKTPKVEGGFSEADIKQLILSPIPRKRRRYVSFVFIIEGYLLEFFVPSIPLNESSRLGVLKNSKVLYVPNKNIFEVEELMKIMVAGYRKAALGMVALQNR